MMIFGARINALACFKTNYEFSKSGPGDTEAESKQHDLAEKKLQTKKWNEDTMKQVDFINTML